MSGLVPVSEALDAIFAQISPTAIETIELSQAARRVLAEPAVARRNQPPFASSAMDGYAIAADSAAIGARFRVIGEAAAGHAFDGAVGAGEAVRIFTGAPVPAGAGHVVIQEDVTRDADMITLSPALGDGTNIRPEGSDFTSGTSLGAPRRLSARDVALLASMNVPQVRVHARPRVAIIATGDELVMPGETPRADQIIASNSLGLKAVFEAEGAEVQMPPIARDTPESLSMVLSLAEGADMIVTIGGASVGDHDIVGEVAMGLGLERAFYKVAMRPGKPLMAGRIGSSTLIGLPGNPVSSMVCGYIFIVPALRAMQGLPARPRRREIGVLARDIGPNGPREHYMRSALDLVDGVSTITPENRQDSSLLSVLSGADCLMVRPPREGALAAGSPVSFIRL